MENPETSELTGRVFVLLQGPTSFFFTHLGQELRRRGACVIRVGFCPGDRLYWRKRGGTYAPYRKTRREFAEWITNLLVEENATDIVMLGDGRWPHASGIQAIRIAQLRTQVWIVEHGYLRPDLILIEPNGMGGGSEIPTLPVPAHDESGPAEPQRWPSSFARYAALDIVYHMTNILVSPIGYPPYRAHSGIHPFREYPGWIGKSLHARRRRRKSARVQTQIEDHEGPLFLYPLQLSHDMQLLKYGTGEDQTRVLEHVIASFSENAM